MEREQKNSNAAPTQTVAHLDQLGRVQLGGRWHSRSHTETVVARRERRGVNKHAKQPDSACTRSQETQSYR
jgi:hypothetical protein